VCIVGSHPQIIMNAKIVAISCLLALAGAAPSPDADAEAFHGLGYGLAHHAPVAAYHAGPAANCVTENDILITQNCVPSTENICNTITVDTEEIEYVKVCKETTDHLCDAPIAHADYGHHVYRREADAEAEADADAFYGAGYAGYAHAGAYAHGDVAHHAGAYAHHAVAPIVASAVGHSVSATVKHACRDVTTEHCVDNPTVKIVPVDVEHCHVITKVACTDVENLIPVTTCEAVTTTHVSEAAYHVAPVVHHVAPVAVAHHVAPVAVAHAGYAAHHY